MTLEDLGNLGEAIGSIGVLVTLAFLVLQIRRSNRETIATRAQAVTDNYNTVLLSMTSSGPQASIFRRGFEDPDSLDADETLIFHTHLTALLGQTDNMVAHQQRGLLDDSTEPGLVIMAQYLSTPGGRAWWETVRDLPSETVRTRLEGMMPESDEEWHRAGIAQDDRGARGEGEHVG